jgi:hypothetical protein
MNARSAGSWGWKKKRKQSAAVEISRARRNEYWARPSKGRERVWERVWEQRRCRFPFTLDGLRGNPSRAVAGGRVISGNIGKYFTSICVYARNIDFRPAASAPNSWLRVCARACVCDSPYALPCRLWRNSRV